MSIVLQKVVGLVNYFDSTYPRNSSIKVSEVVKLLQELIDEEEAHLEKMYEEFEQSENWRTEREEYLQMKLFDN